MLFAYYSHHAGFLLPFCTKFRLACVYDVFSILKWIVLFCDQFKGHLKEYRISGRDELSQQPPLPVWRLGKRLLFVNNPTLYR
jgi:hypothetical protein